MDFLQRDYNQDSLESSRNINKYDSDYKALAGVMNQTPDKEEKIEYDFINNKEDFWDEIACPVRSTIDVHAGTFIKYIPFSKHKETEEENGRGKIKKGSQSKKKLNKQIERLIKNESKNINEVSNTIEDRTEVYETEKKIENIKATSPEKAIKANDKSLNLSLNKSKSKASNNRLNESRDFKLNTKTNKENKGDVYVIKTSIMSDSDQKQDEDIVVRDLRKDYEDKIRKKQEEIS